MEERLDYAEIAPELPDAVLDLEPGGDENPLCGTLTELVKLRVSQVNGCAYCVDLHSRELGESGVDDRKVSAVVAWEESPFFTPRERTALAVAEELTRLPTSDVPSGLFDRSVDEFGPGGIVALVRVIVAINCWNRIWAAFRFPTIDALEGRTE